MKTPHMRTMKTHGRSFRGWFLGGVGCLLGLLGLRMAKHFFEFPAIPGLLTVTFWPDTLAFAILAATGAALAVWGLARSRAE